MTQSKGCLRGNQSYQKSGRSLVHLTNSMFYGLNKCRTNILLVKVCFQVLVDYATHIRVYNGCIHIVPFDRLGLGQLCKYVKGMFPQPNWYITGFVTQLMVMLIVPFVYCNLGNKIVTLCASWSLFLTLCLLDLALTC